MSLAMLGQTIGHLDRHDEAIATCSQAAARAAGIGEPSYELATVYKLAYVKIVGGGGENAVDICQQARTLAIEVGDRRAVGLSYGLQGDAYRLAGRWGEAVAVYREALAIFQASFIRRHSAVCLYKLGLTHQATGENEQAVSLFGESLAIFEELRLEAHVRLLRDAMAKSERTDR